MHICHITFTQIPSRRAHSVQVMKVCQALARGGHQVTLLIPDAKGICDGNLKAVWHHYGIREPFDMQTLPAPIPAYSYFSFPRILTAHSFALQSVRRVQEIGADIVKVKYDGNVSGLKWAVESAGKTKVVIAGGMKKDETLFLKQVNDIMNTGAIGLAVGRNIWQHENPLLITKKVRKIVWG